jgi:N-acetylglucosamine malate deacetylase 1
MVCGGHPGDPEYGCGGTVARLTGLGHQVLLLYLNDGAWPPTPASVRIAEATKACEILKSRPAYAGQINGHAVIDNAHYDEFQKLIAAESPDAIITQWPIDNHADHRAITMLTYNAWHKLGQKFAMYFYEVSNGEDTVQFSPNCYVDISETEPQKRAACYAHASQTPDRYYALQDDVARFRGIERGCKRAEAFLHQLQSPYDIFPLAQTYTLS